MVYSSTIFTWFQDALIIQGYHHKLFVYQDDYPNPIVKGSDNTYTTYLRGSLIKFKVGYFMSVNSQKCLIERSMVTLYHCISMKKYGLCKVIQSIESWLPRWSIKNQMFCYISPYSNFSRNAQNKICVYC